MTHKEKAIQGLESITHWMKTSTFDYDKKSLRIVLGNVFMDYKKYLDEKFGSKEPNILYNQNLNYEKSKRK